MGKISAYTALTSLTDDDYLVVVNDPAGTPETRRITAANAYNYFHATATAAIVAAYNAPADWLAAATYLCDGVSDEVQINAALTAAPGIIQLSPGTFQTGAAVKMLDSRWLRGNGTGANGTNVYASGPLWAAYDATPIGGVIEPYDANQQKFRVSDMNISGFDVQRGIYDNTVSSNPGGWDSHDAYHAYHDLYLSYCAAACVDLRTFRGARVRDVKIFDTTGVANADGFYLATVDSFFHNLDVGAVTGYGMNLNTVNSRFSNCKSWYSTKDGFLVDSGAVRNQFATCEAQDNLLNGFTIYGARNDFYSCHADSNSYDLSSSGAPTGRGNYGVYIWAADCNFYGQSYDKNEGSRGVRQSGLFLHTGSTNCQVHIITNGNYSVGVTLGAPFDTSNVIHAVGQSNIIRMPDRLTGTATYDPANLTNGSSDSTQTVTVTGAAVGDVVVGVGHTSITQAGWAWRADVTATNTVSVVLTNNTGGTLNLASGTLTVHVAKNT